MGAPAISVAMSVYNAERFLSASIESILSQTFSDFEFLILDDGSSDGSRDIYESYAARDRRIRTIVRENRGLIVSLNQLLAEAQAPIVARMDADDISYPDRFAKQKAFLDANPDHGVVGAWCDDIDEAGNRRNIEGPEHPVTHEALLAAIDRDAPLLCHPVVTYRRDLIRSVGGYHAAFKHCEDFDLWLRLASVTKLANIPDRLLQYRHSPGQVTSRHATEMRIGHAVALCAYHERQAGRPDPTTGLAKLPPIKDLDALFGLEGVSQSVAAVAARGLLYSRSALRSESFELVMQLARGGDGGRDLWRTVARLIRFGAPLRAAKLAAALAKAA